MLDLFYSASNDRRKLLDWCIKSLDADSESAGDSSEIISSLGLCSSADAKSNFIFMFCLSFHFLLSVFVSGKMNKRNQLKIWTDLSSLLPHTSIDLDNLRLDTKRYVDIVESLADEVKFDTFGKSRLMILPFHFDKELKKSKVKESDLPSLETLSEVLENGKQLLVSLEQFSDYSEDDEASLMLLNSVGEVCDELKNNLETLDVKHNTEFVPWMKSSNESRMTRKRNEIVEAEKLLKQLSSHFHHKSNIAESVNKVLKLKSTDLKKLSKNIPSIEVSENPVDSTIVNFSKLNMSRAPAAS